MAVFCKRWQYKLILTNKEFKWLQNEMVAPTYIHCSCMSFHAECSRYSPLRATTSHDSASGCWIWPLPGSLHIWRSLFARTSHHGFSFCLQRMCADCRVGLELGQRHRRNARPWRPSEQRAVSGKPSSREPYSDDGQFLQAAQGDVVG